LTRTAQDEKAVGLRKGKAADSLGISRKNLWEKLKMHGICAPPDAGTDARADSDGPSVAA
jgi:DNA-binding NtrC family response regulator